jgi:hypothetical protein
MAAITGADSGSTTTIYYQTLSVLEGASRWTAGGTVTGNGSTAVTGTGSGSYFWYATGTVSAAPAVSNIIPQSLSNAATQSVHYQILLAYQALLQALKLFGGKPQQVQLTWSAKGALQVLGQRPGCVIFPHTSEGQGDVMANTDDVDYPTCIALFDNAAGPIANLPRNLLARQQVFRALRHVRVPGVPTTITTTVQPKEIVLDDWFDAKGLWYSALLMRPVSRERRGAP